MLKDQLFKQVDCSLTTGFSGPESSRDFRETGYRLRYTNSIGLVKKNDHFCMFPCLGWDPQLFYFINSMMSVELVVVYQRLPCQSGAAQIHFVLAAIVSWN